MSPWQRWLREVVYQAAVQAVRARRDRVEDLMDGLEDAGEVFSEAYYDLTDEFVLTNRALGQLHYAWQNPWSA